MIEIDLGKRMMASVVALCAVGLLALAYLDRDVYVATVVKKERIVEDGRAPEYLIHTTLADGRARTFKYRHYYLADSTFVPPDLGATLEEGKTYYLDTRGVRIPWTSIYEGIFGVHSVASP